MEYTYIEYGGFVKNIKTGKYERLFTTQMSELLARNRAIEAASNANQNPDYQYDVNDTIVKKRIVKSEYGEWETIFET